MQYWYTRKLKSMFYVRFDFAYTVTAIKPRRWTPTPERLKNFLKEAGSGFFSASMPSIKQNPWVEAKPCQRALYLMTPTDGWGEQKKANTSHAKASHDEKTQQARKDKPSAEQPVRKTYVSQAWNNAWDQIQVEVSQNKVDARVNEKIDRDRKATQEEWLETSRLVNRPRRELFQLAAPPEFAAELTELAHTPGLFGDAGPTGVMRIMNTFLQLGILNETRSTPDEVCAGLIELIMHIAELKPANFEQAHLMARQVIATEVTNIQIARAMRMVHPGDFNSTIKMAQKGFAIEAAQTVALNQLRSIQERKADALMIDVEVQAPKRKGRSQSKRMIEKSAAVKYQTPKANDDCPDILKASEAKAG